jgi:hypothetical protein
MDLRFHEYIFPGLIILWRFKHDLSAIGAIEDMVDNTTGSCA